MDLIKVAEQAFATGKELPEFLPGDTITVAYRIKEGNKERIQQYRGVVIKINGEMIPNRADCITLSTFSSHANCDDLVKFGSSLNTNKLILVHGSKEAKNCLAEKLRVAISKNDKTFKVIESFKGMMIKL